MTIFRNFLAGLVSRVTPSVEPPPPSPSGTMQSQHREVIVQFAHGDQSLRDRAIAIHRTYIPILGVRGTPEMCFMAEVDNPAPDVGLRVQYREILVRREAA